MEIRKFINDGIAQGWVRETGNSNIVRVGGKNEDCPVYEVRIDHLRYNLQNGRIATSMNRYQREQGPLPEDPEQVALLIEGMIERDNPGRLKKTKLDIKARGQQEVAIILSNGIVIDGNRRFTCLRQLSREEHEQRFLRCYIFPDTYDANDIKALELEVQMGRDEKLDYDAIALLSDIREWVVNGSMDSEVYRKHAGITKGKMRSNIKQVGLIDEFLELIEAPGEWYIAKDLKIQGPIESLASKLGKIKNEDERENMKLMVFANLAALSEGDRTRNLRQTMDNFLQSMREETEFAEEQMEFAERVLEKIGDRDEGERVTSEFLRDHVMADKDLKHEMKASHSKNQAKMDGRKVKQGQLDAVSDALESVGEVKTDLLFKLSIDQLKEMVEGLDELVEAAGDLKSAVAAELEGRA